MYTLRLLAKWNLRLRDRPATQFKYKVFCPSRRNDSTLAFGRPLLTKCVPTSQGDLDTSKPYVNIPLSSGRYVRRQITPTKNSDPLELVSALSPLFNNPRHDPELNESTSSFGSLKWHLDRRGDAIHRFLMLANQRVGNRVIKLIEEAANAMNHHPHITEAIGPQRRGREPVRLVTITCTTHFPSGLSMQDAKLAQEINRILEPFDILHSPPRRPSESTRLAIRHKRAEMKQTNREKIWNATGRPEMTMFGRSGKWIE